ncbi:hypothetical protein HYS85_01880, partial [Candidatus Saccharibacteria bacterium]|nr:hypothetical protein [Candidatus Saccharibacteria bacterium]
LAGLLLWVPLLPAGGALVYAQTDKLISPDVCNQAPSSEVCKEAQNQSGDDPISGPGGIINKAANIIAIISGVAAVIIIIIGGIMYATAGGAAVGQRAGDSPNRAKKAQAAITGALIGLVVIALAWTITRFIVDRVVQ